MSAILTVAELSMLRRHGPAGPLCLVQDQEKNRQSYMIINNLSC
jgi:hypothetical protein